MPSQEHSTQFEQQVITSLAELKTQMKALVGNGQPGRISKIEDAQSRLAGRLLKLFIIVLVLALLGLGPQALALLKYFP